jgi:hypothetical protein
MVNKTFILLALLWVNITYAGDSVQLGNKLQSASQSSHAPRLVYHQEPAFISDAANHIYACLNGGALNTLYSTQPTCTVASVIYD